jgi:hypothetical protein
LILLLTVFGGERCKARLKGIQAVMSGRHFAVSMPTLREKM